MVPSKCVHRPLRAGPSSFGFGFEGVLSCESIFFFVGVLKGSQQKATFFFLFCLFLGGGTPPSFFFGGGPSPKVKTAGVKTISTPEVREQLAAAPPSAAAPAAAHGARAEALKRGFQVLPWALSRPSWWFSLSWCSWVSELKPLKVKLSPRDGICVF